MSAPLREPSPYVRKQFESYRDGLRRRGMQVNQMLLSFQELIAARAEHAMAAEGIDEPTRQRVINRLLHGTSAQVDQEENPQ